MISPGKRRATTIFWLLIFYLVLVESFYKLKNPGMNPEGLGALECLEGIEKKKIQLSKFSLGKNASSLVLKSVQQSPRNCKNPNVPLLVAETKLPKEGGPYFWVQFQSLKPGRPFKKREMTAEVFPAIGPMGYSPKISNTFFIKNILRWDGFLFLVKGERKNLAKGTPIVGIHWGFKYPIWGLNPTLLKTEILPIRFTQEMNLALEKLTQ